MANFQKIAPFDPGEHASKTLAVTNATANVLISDYATGGYTVGAQPTAADFITINGHVITFVAGTAADDEVQIGGTASDTATAVRSLINAADATKYGCKATGATTAITLTAIAIGTDGNSITTTEDVTSASFTVAGPTLTVKGGPYHSMIIYNSGASDAFIELGNNADVTASATTSMPIKAGTSRLVIAAPYVAAITASSTSTLWVTPGDGGAGPAV